MGNGAVAMISGTVKFGPALLDEATSDAYTPDYEYAIYFANNCNETVNEAVGRVSKGRGVFGCCEPDVYQVELKAVPVPNNYTRLAVVVRTATGRSSLNKIIPFVDADFPPPVPAGAQGKSARHLLLL